jgi:hypothetical protein
LGLGKSTVLTVFPVCFQFPNLRQLLQLAGFPTLVPALGNHFIRVFFSQKKCRQPTACQTTCVPSLAPIQVAKELLKGDPLTLGNFDQVWGALVRRGCGGLWLAKMGYMAMARKGGSI